MAVKQVPAVQASASFILCHGARDPPGSYDARARPFKSPLVFADSTLWGVRSMYNSMDAGIIAVEVSTMPARHRERYSSSLRNLSTITPESCPPSNGITVHDALESPSTMSRNNHASERGLDFMIYASTICVEPWDPGWYAMVPRCIWLAPS